jgi:hypothetical protein
MQGSRVREAFLVGVFLFAGLAVLGYLLGSSALRIKQFERAVTVKGLAEKEVPADVAVWPILSMANYYSGGFRQVIKAAAM